VNSDPAKVAVFLIIQTTSSPLTSETYISKIKEFLLYQKMPKANHNPTERHKMKGAKGLLPPTKLK
jgi:hypothetical protein